MVNGLSGILGNGGLQGTIEDIANRRTGRSGRRAREEAPGSENGELDWFSIASFSLTGNALVQDQEVRIAEFVVPAQVGYVYGFGEPAPGKEENQGAIYVDLQDSVPNELDGWLRLRSENAVGKEVDDHGRFHSSRLRVATGTPSEWIKLPERDMEMVTEDSVLYLTFEADNATDAGQTVDEANSDVKMTMTEFTQG